MDTLERSLLKQSLEKTGHVPISSKEPCSYLSKYGSTLAMADIAGRTEKEVNWYSNKERFVCLHCLMESVGFRIPYPLRARKSNKTGITQWIVMGSFGSVGCAIKYMSDHRHTFINETAGLLISLLIRVYKVDPQITLALPKAPSRSDLPPFQSNYLTKQGEKAFDGLAFHQSLSIPMKVPSKQHHHIVCVPTTILIDTHVSPTVLNISKQDMKEMFPNFYMRSNGKAHVSKGPELAKKPEAKEKKEKVTLDAFLPEKIIP